jgi:hypothetical protein
LASAWGSSWGTSWLDSWGATAAGVVTVDRGDAVFSGQRRKGYDRERLERRNAVERELHPPAPETPAEVSRRVERQIQEATAELFGGQWPADALLAALGIPPAPVNLTAGAEFDAAMPLVQQHLADQAAMRAAEVARLAAEEDEDDVILLLMAA